MLPCIAPVQVARSYGEAFGADSWAVNLFAEEVIRGGPAFAVSLVLSRWAGTRSKAGRLGQQGRVGLRLGKEGW